MKHLLCDSVYSEDGIIPSMIPDTDGVELLTGYSSVTGYPLEKVSSVHLPYATDWYGIWSGDRKVSDDVDAQSVPYMYYGPDREGIVDNIVRAIEVAEPLHPSYGVFHACSANFDELGPNGYTDDDTDVMHALTEILNLVAASLGGEMPFPLALENLWWPGFRMLGPSGFRYLEKHLEFDNWCICLDTGHLLIAAGGSDDEIGSIEKLDHIADSYPKDMIDRIRAMHLHNNTSAPFIGSFRLPDGFYDQGHMGRYRAAYRFICDMDQHRPFTDPSIVDYVERLSPDFVNHEMGAVASSERVSDYMIQRSLFKKHYI